MFDKMIIRKAKLGDSKKVYELCRIKELINPSWELPKLWWIESFVKENQLFFIAEEDKDIVGFILGERTCGDIGYLWILAVKKEFQHKGIGTSLFLRAEEECKKRKLKAIICYGYEKSKNTLKIIKKRKYEKGRRYFEFIKLIWILVCIRINSEI